MSTSRSMCVSSVKVYSRKDNRRRAALMGGSFWRVSFFNSTVKRGQEIPAESLSGICLGSPFLHNKFLIFPLAFLTKVMYYIKVS